VGTDIVSIGEKGKGDWLYRNMLEVWHL